MYKCIYIYISLSKTPKLYDIYWNEDKKEKILREKENLFQLYMKEEGKKSGKGGEKWKQPPIYI